MWNREKRNREPGLGGLGLKVLLYAERLGMTSLKNWANHRATCGKKSRAGKWRVQRPWSWVPELWMEGQSKQARAGGYQEQRSER